MNIEYICEVVHKAYCKERIKQGRDPYWTDGDYSKLDEATKDYDRVIVKAVLAAIHTDRLEREDLLERFRTENKRLQAKIKELEAKIESYETFTYPWIDDKWIVKNG